MPKRVSLSTSVELRNSWIERVDVNAFTTNGELIFCNACQCNLQIQNCTNLQHHARSSKHRNNVAKKEIPVSDTDSLNNLGNSNLGTGNQESYSDSNVTETQIKTEPISPCCANCNVSLEDESTEICTELLIDTEEDHWTSKPEKIVTILDALKTIFDFSFHSDESDAIKERLMLCGTCGKSLADLYRLFCEFKLLCHEESLIKNRIGLRKDSCVTDAPVVRPKRRIEKSVNEEQSRKSRMRALKKRQRLKLKPRLCRNAAKSRNDAERNPFLASGYANERDDNKIDQEEPFDNPHSILGLEYSGDENSPQPKTPEEPASDSEAEEDTIPSRGRRGRPRKVNEDPDYEAHSTPKRSRGRPRKSKCTDPEAPAVPKRARGRPRKIQPCISDSETETPVVVQPRGRGRPKKENHTRKRYYGLKKYKCDICGKVSKSSGNHMNHIRGVHEGVIRYKHKCATCGKYFTSKTNLLNHIRVIHGQESNKFLCPEPGCGKTFAYYAGLYVHKFVHTGELKFSCDVCGKKFRRGCDVSKHRVRHTSERPYICEHCGNSFKTRQNLNKHIVIHDENGRFKGKPPPTCTTCGKTFLRPENLRIHIRTIHEKQLPFKCPLCGKLFSGSSNLKVHLHGFHKCPKDDNNKIVLPPTFPLASNDEASDDSRTIPNPVPGHSREENIEPRDLQSRSSQSHPIPFPMQSLDHGFPVFVHRPTASISIPETKNSFTRDTPSFFGYNT